MSGFKKHLFREAVFLFVIVLFVGCDPWFAYSPYEANVSQRYQGATDSNLARINDLDADDRQSFKVALLSDPHYHYTKLDQAITYINNQGDFDFAIVLGDLTENGLKQEFVYFYESMSRLKIPYVTVIGNHDYLSNGEVVYRQMFGAYNYSFVFNNVKFVMFDNNTVESGKDPDMEWFARQLQNDKGYDHVVPLAHIPPYDQQMARHHLEYHSLMEKNDIDLSIHGHRHEYSLVDVYGDGIEYITVSSPQKRTFTELIITPEDLNVKKIDY